MSTYKTIHQAWTDHDVPTECTSYIESWKVNHPDWEYRFWTHDSVLEFISKQYSWFLHTYESYKLDIQRADAARHLILHHYGGLYCDLDIKCYKPIDELLDDTCVVFDTNPDDYDDLLTNSIYYAPKSCKFMMMCAKTLNTQQNMKPMEHEHEGSYVLRSTGPVFFNSVYHRWKHVFPIRRETHERFERLSSNSRRSLTDTYIPSDKEFGVHYSMGSWY